jgi:hypothetical protein
MPTDQPVAAGQPSDPQPDPWLQRFREIFTGALAVVVIAGFTVMMVVAMGHVGKDQQDSTFQRIKDLLAIVSPVVGVVIGYYFSKTSIEARAEGAEHVARAATSTARVAEHARADAEAKTNRIASEGRRLHSAAGTYLASTRGELGANGDGAVRSRVELESAVDDYGRGQVVPSAVQA